jgi:plastocyanin
MDADRVTRLETLVLALLVPIVAALTVLVTVSVTSDATGAAPAKLANGARAITIENFQYAPDPIGVEAGTTVTVTNHDATAHTLTADDGDFDTGDLARDESVRIVLDSPGRYTYHCTLHRSMRGVIEVR